MQRIEIDEDARADIDGIYDHIGHKLKSPQAADRIIDELDEAFRRHASQPGIGEARPDLGRDIRVFTVASYVAIYRPLDDGIRVLRVVVGNRDFRRLFRG